MFGRRVEGEEKGVRGRDAIVNIVIELKAIYLCSIWLERKKNRRRKFYAQVVNFRSHYYLHITKKINTI